MSFAKCFDVVSMVIEEASEQFKPLWKMNMEHREVLRSYCEIIDSMAKEFEGEAFEVEVDDIKMTVKIAMECPDMTISDRGHLYYKLLQHTVSFGFSVSDEGNLKVEFEFPSLWERA